MNFPYFIIVSGPPASGKTTLAKNLAISYNLPFMNKDTIKETLFDSLGTGDRSWSKKLGLSSNNLLYVFLEANLKAKKSLVIENAFLPEFEKQKVESVLDKTGGIPIEVYCHSNDQVIIHRFVERNLSGNRHEGHIQQEVLPELEKRLINNSYSPLGLNDMVINIDTTNLQKISIQNVVKMINNFKKSR